jgi:hypothetical protein
MLDFLKYVATAAVSVFVLEVATVGSASWLLIVAIVGLTWLTMWCRRAAVAERLCAKALQARGLEAMFWKTLAYVAAMLQVGWLGFARTQGVSREIIDSYERDQEERFADERAKRKAAKAAKRSGQSSQVD